MTRASRILLSAAILLSLATGMAEAAPEQRLCARAEVAVEVLGSGGPMHGDGRGNSAYLVWLNHKPAVVIDMGGDTAAKLAAAGVEAGSVGTLLISHLHPDHVSGLPDYLWGEITAQRTRKLMLAGPAGGGAGFPDIKTFLERQFAAGGLYPRMQGLFDGSAFPLAVQVVPVDQPGAIAIANDAGLKITAYSVRHGPAPALAYRLDGDEFLHRLRRRPDLCRSRLLALRGGRRSAPHACDGGGWRARQRADPERGPAARSGPARRRGGRQACGAQPSDAGARGIGECAALVARAISRR